MSRSVGETKAEKKWPTPAGMEDIRVVEIGAELGDFCGMLLAGEGADVIKVEPPEGSDSRRIGPFYQDVPDRNRSLFFWNNNRGKRGVSLKLDSPEGKRRYLDLVARADVVIDAQPLDYMDSLGLGYDAVKKINSKVIYCSITPFGLTGPWRNFKGSDLVHQALGGSAYCIGYAQTEPGKWDTPPFMAQAWHSYAITAEHAALAVAAAIYHRDASGEGQLIDVSVHDCCAQSTEGTVTRYLYTKHLQMRNTPQQLKCGDGNYLAVVITMLRMASLPKLQEVVGEELAGELRDPQFGDPSYAKTAEADNRIAKTLSKWVIGKTVDEAFHALQKCGVICGPVRAPEELTEDPQCQERNNFVAVEHPELGRSFLYPRHPNHRTETPWRWGPRAPLVGEHNAMIWDESRS